jgi:hypothetical protein
VHGCDSSSVSPCLGCLFVDCLQKPVTTEYSIPFYTAPYPHEAPSFNLDEKSKRLLMIVIPACGLVVLSLFIILIIIIARLVKIQLLLVFLALRSCWPEYNAAAKSSTSFDFNVLTICYCKDTLRLMRLKRRYIYVFELTTYFISFPPTV